MNQSKNLCSPYKLLKHLESLEAFEKGEDFSPIEVNINVSNRCNNHCPLCTTKNKDGILIPTKRIKEVIQELGEMGVKSSGYGGGGEPTCHPDFEEILKHSHKNKIEFSVYTNGLEMSPGMIDAIIDFGTFIRISLDADGPEIYKKTHGMDEQAFYSVIKNIKKLVEIKRNKNSNITIGINYLLGPHTAKGIYNAAKLAREIGVDDIRFRPFFDFGKSIIKEEEAKLITEELMKAKELETPNFSVSYSENRCESMSDKKPRKYAKCYINHFVPIITPDLKVYPCCFLVDKEEYLLGDLGKTSFKELWSSQNRRESSERINFKDCPNPCMLEKQNELLNAIKTNNLPKGMKLIDLLKSINEPIPHSSFF